MKEQWVFRASAGELLTFFEKKVLPAYSKNIVRGKEFVYAAGRIPVLLVAHVDTVHARPPEKIFYDQEQQVLWSPDGLGADDRAGVLGILELLQRGLLPHVLLLDGEERGCTGAAEAVAALPAPDVRYIVELDRKNSTEAVFYDCANQKFERYILSFGFTRAEGTFTDITVLCPAWGIAGVNLSCGYYDAHTKLEYLNLKELRGTLKKVENMFRNVPKKQFKYIASARAFSWEGRRWWDNVYPVSPSRVNDTRRSFCYCWSNSYDIHVEVDLDEIVLLHGGDEFFWESWLDNNYKTLVEAAEKAVMAEIAKAAEMEVSNLVEESVSDM